MTTRERLLDAAEELTGRGDVSEVTLAEVGARAGVSRQAVYLNFRNRATLLTEMLRRIDRSSGFIGRIIAARALTPREGLLRTIEEWFGYLPTILAVSRALEAAVVAGDEGAGGYTARMSEWRGAIRLPVARLHKGNELSSGWDVEAATDWVYSRALPAVYAELVAVRGWDPEDVARRTIRGLEAELLESR